MSREFCYFTRVSLLRFRLKNDRARQEQLAKERLERLRNKRTSKDETSNNMEASIKDGDDIQEVLIKHVDDRQTQEQMVGKFIKLLSHSEQKYVHISTA